MIHFCSSLCLNSPYKWAYAKDCQNYNDTDTYLEFATMMLRSVYKHHPDSRFYLLGMNLNNTQVQTLKNVHPLANTLSFDFKKINDQQHYKGIIEWNRIVFIWQKLAMEKVAIPKGDILVYLDIDCLLRAPLKIFKYMTDLKLDIGVLKRNAKQYDKEINMGVLFIRNTQPSRDFISAWMDGLPAPEGLLPKRADSERTYSHSQAIFNHLMQSKQYKGVQFWPLPTQFNDKRLSNDSTIWHGNRGNKFDRLKDFRKEISQW